MGGVGKSALSVQLVHNIKDYFDYVLWYSIREAPPVKELITDLIKFLSEQQTIEFSTLLTEQIEQLIQYFKKASCLIILDNVESIILDKNSTGVYRKDYQGYGELFDKIENTSHRSCLVITSREAPPKLSSYENHNSSTHSLVLTGLSVEAKMILEKNDVRGNIKEYNEIISLYQGNPQALKIVSSHIKDLYNGNLTSYLAELNINAETVLFDDIEKLLDQHFNRLSDSEKQIIYWLAINREAISIPELRDDILQFTETNKLTQTLASLKRRFFN